MQHSLAPDKPFFAYYAPGLTHAPHHAPKEWIAKFKGQFDQGWDKLREETLARQKKHGRRPGRRQADAAARRRSRRGIRCSADQKKLYARMMEVYAGAPGVRATTTSAASSRRSKRPGELDNTLIIYIHGRQRRQRRRHACRAWPTKSAWPPMASTESLPYLLSIMDELGGPTTYNHYPVGWAHAMDTPFQWTKQVASHFGGTRNGLVISWPKRIKQTGRSPLAVQLGHRHRADDPRGRRRQGADDDQRREADADRRRQHGLHASTMPRRRRATRRSTSSCSANRGIYHDGWMASTTPLRLPWARSRPAWRAPNPDDFKWELYHVAEDFSQANNLAAQNPAKLKELQAVFDREAQEVQRLSARRLVRRARRRVASVRA